MSNDALTWAWRAPLASGPKFVLVALADHGSDHSGEDWTCWPSIERLTSRTGQGEKTVRRHLDALEADGWISRQRRRRADGKLGIYVYQLRRARLDEALAEVAGTPDVENSPAVKLTGGEVDSPAVKLTVTSGQIDHSPAVKLTAQEPLREPKGEPSQRASAREPGDEGFEEAAQAWPESGRTRTDWPKARAAWAKACGEIEADQLLAAVRLAAVDPRIASGDFGWAGLHVWLSGERWRPYAERLAAGSGTASSAAAAGWAGPPALRAAIVAERGEGWAASYLDRAAWDGEAVRAATQTAADKLAGLSWIFEQHGARVVGPNDGGKA